MNVIDLHDSHYLLIPLQHSKPSVIRLEYGARPRDSHCHSVVSQYKGLFCLQYVRGAEKEFECYSIYGLLKLCFPSVIYTGWNTRAIYNI